MSKYNSPCDNVSASSRRRVSMWSPALNINRFTVDQKLRPYNSQQLGQIRTWIGTDELCKYIGSPKKVSQVLFRHTLLYCWVKLCELWYRKAQHLFTDILFDMLDEGWTKSAMHSCTHIGVEGLMAVAYKERYESADVRSQSRAVCQTFASFLPFRLSPRHEKFFKECFCHFSTLHVTDGKEYK